MAFVQPRQPFAVLDESRLQTLTSIKNRQNNILSQNASFKTPASAPAKRRLASDMLADEFDSENVDPNMLLSPSKRAKNFDATPVKVPKFILSESAPQTVPTSLNPSTKRKALSASVPSTATSTPFTNLRGSPQNKRLQLLGAKRRSSTPFRRFDPPSKGSSIPFSIDAALSGTISSYPPVPATTSSIIDTTSPSPVLSKKSSKSMPNTWFFEIHEDTVEQEATNLMEHSASTLDISSDDDSMTARAKDALERGKENIPPPEWTGVTRATRPQRITHKGISCSKAAVKYAVADSADAMLEDRVALREMDVAAFCSEDVEDKSTPEAKTVIEQTIQEAAIVVSEEATIVSQSSTEVKETIVICEDAPVVSSS